MRKILWIAARIALIFVAAKACWMLAIMAEATWRQLYSGDALIFLSVGQGILNGLTPYADVWETKPVGVFLLSALSLLLHDRTISLRIIEILCLGLFPVILAATAARLTRDAKRWERVVHVAGAFFLGTILSFFSFRFDDGLSTEALGALPGLIYVVMLLFAPSTLSWKWIVSLGVMFCATVLFKEPFAITLWAATFAIRRPFTSSIDTIIQEGVVALALYTGIFAALGALTAYVTIYLPYMMKDHMQLVALMFYGVGHEAPPFWTYGLRVDTTWWFLRESEWLIAVSVTVCWLLYLLEPLLRAERKARRIVTHVAIFLFMTYMATFATNTSGEWGHRVIMAIPWFCALFFMNVRTLRAMRNVQASRAVSIALTTLFAFAVLALPMRWEHFLKPPTEPFGEDFARDLDAMLDACGIDRYLTVSTMYEQPYGFTKHSPLPAGSPLIRLEERLSVPLFKSMLEDSLEKAEVVLIKNPEFVNRKGYATEAVKYLAKVYEQFDFAKPPCAASFTYPDTMFVLFRKH